MKNSLGRKSSVQITKFFVKWIHGGAQLQFCYTIQYLPQSIKRLMSVLLSSSSSFFLLSPAVGAVLAHDLGRIWTFHKKEKLI